MEKLATLGDVKIHCDECHHEFPGEPPDWHGEPCPECGQGVLINDEDMDIWTLATEALAALNSIVSDIPQESLGTKGVSFKISTAGLRSNDHAQVRHTAHHRA